MPGTPQPKTTYDFWSRLNAGWRHHRNVHTNFADFQTALFRQGLRATREDGTLLANEIPARHAYTRPKSVSLSINITPQDNDSVSQYANGLATPQDEVIVVFTKIGFDNYV